jgi:hypothetical protein
VFDHSLQAVAALETLLGGGCPLLAPHRSVIRPLHDPAAAARLKCAALLHDIGKPVCRTTDSAGRIHFYGHAARGAEMIGGICRRLRLSRSQAVYLDGIVRHHNRVLPLFGQWRRKRLSPRAVARFFKACGDLSPDLVLHAMADMNAKSADDSLWHPFVRFGIELIEQFYSHFEPIRRSPPLINGRDLMHCFGLRPSPLIGRLLDQVQIARLAGTITTRNEAEALVEKILHDQRPAAGPVNGTSRG